MAAPPRASGPGDAPVVQVFGRADSQATRRCRRFFSDRRIGVSFVDLARRSLAPTELRRFSERFGATALLDPETPAYRTAGLGYLRMGDAEVLSRLLADPSLLRLPLVRLGSRLSVGLDEDAWKAWLRDLT